MTQAGPTASDLDPESVAALIDMDRGLVNRAIYTDEAIYRLELQRIFARTWNFMCHDSQIPNVGDYFINYIGEDQVIVVRDQTGEVRVLLNSCTHRGNTLCRAEQGNAKSFTCTYHGWNYGLDGRLIGVPGRKPYYRGALDEDRLGLAKAAQVAQRNGFYFATLDAQAPPLDEFLGDVGCVGLDTMTLYGDVCAIDGVQKNIVDCNWKIAVDNIFDWYHVKYTHVSAISSGAMSAGIEPMNQMVMLGEFGHGISGPMVTAEQQAALDAMAPEEFAKLNSSVADGPVPRPPAAKDKLGPLGIRAVGHPHLFPNLWIAVRGMQLCLRLPRGPHKTELWWFTFLPKNYSLEERRKALRYMKHLFGPAGMLEQDDGENWNQATETASGTYARTIPHVLQMGLGCDDVIEDPASGQRAIETRINEHGQRWIYRNWAEWIRADNWDQLKAAATAPPVGRI